MTIARLNDRGVIALDGPETRPFLQGLITNDIEKLLPGSALYAALLTPQGKILFDFFLIENEGRIFLDCARAAREALLKRLSLYRLRAKVTLGARDDLAVLAGWGSAAAGRDVSFPDPRVPALGRRALVEAQHVPASIATEAEYLSRRLEFGVPEAGDFGSDRMFALDADLDELHAISFDKGCYVGQELTARMKHRGTARKRLLPIASKQGQDLPPKDSPLTAAGKNVGEIASAYGPRGFALLRLDRLDETGTSAVAAGDVSVNVMKPAWLFP